MTVSRLQREARRAANRDPHDAPKAHERKAGWTAPASYRKKIDRNIGEYIEYEEITTISAPSTPNDGGDKGNYIHTESQIVDAEWEDIK